MYVHWAILLEVWYFGKGLSNQVHLGLSVALAGSSRVHDLLFFLFPVSITDERTLPSTMLALLLQQTDRHPQLLLTCFFAGGGGEFHRKHPCPWKPRKKRETSCPPPPPTLQSSCALSCCSLFLFFHQSSIWGAWGVSATEKQVGLAGGGGDRVFSFLHKTSNCK